MSRNHLIGCKEEIKMSFPVSALLFVKKLIKVQKFERKNCIMYFLEHAILI